LSRVLVVEDESGLREGLADFLRGMGVDVATAAGVTEARQWADKATFDCVLLDIRLKDGDGLELLRELRDSRQPDVPVVMVTAYGDSERTIRAMRDGAFDYVTKPFELPALRATVERALKQRSLALELPSTTAPAPVRNGLVGASAAMLGIWKLIGRAATTHAPVLITGETGTGKELVARAIHDYSARAKEPFVAVNVAALPPSLIESELFGHERGAFTGAVGRRAGRFELAGNGTLFLDEIGDLDPAMQTKLLRVLQDRRYERVGGSESLPVEARIISATHKPVRPGTPGAVLRDDLYYRLAVLEVEIPPLRARRSDIPLLVSHALEGGPARAVSEDAMALLTRYDWPGNVRELRHVIERAAVLSGGDVVDVANLPSALRATGASALPATGASAQEDPGRAEPAVATAPRSLLLHEAVAALERSLIEKALEQAAGNRSEAARLLGIGRAQLYVKMEDYGLGGPRRGRAG
jgi:DNA-binding NtrC family response regulator